MKLVRLITLIGVYLSLTVAQAQTKKTSSGLPPKSVSVAQGQVARWAGNCLRCSLEKRAWAAVNGTCYYPVDMDMKPGQYTISRRTTGGKLESATLNVAAKECIQEDLDNFPKKEYVTISATNQARATKEAALVNPLIRFQTKE